jgi:PAS domain S-box-containing protein
MSRWEEIRVLCVDDDRESASFTADRLERADSRLTVDTATGARNALARLADNHVDCVVSSYEMSGQTGVEFLQSVREECPVLPFLLFTGEGSEAVASEAISAGVTDYVRADSGTDWHETLADRIADAVETDRTATRQRGIGRALETAQTGVAVLDESFEFVDVDEAYAEVFRYDPDVLVGSPLWRLYSEDEAEQAERSVSSALREDGHWHGEIPVRRADGETPVADHVVSATDGRRYVCLVCAVTDERADKGRLEREQWRFRTLFEQLTRPLAEVEYDGLDPIVRRVNPAFEQTFGCDAADIVGDPLDEHVVPADGRQEAEEIVALSTEDDPESTVQKLEEHPHTRYPLVGADLTDFRGVVYSPALFNHREELSSGSGELSELAAPTMTLSPDTDVSDAIDQFQTERQELALVIEDGEVVGLVTVTDLLETIIGDIEDPLDQDDPVVLG